MSETVNVPVWLIIILALAALATLFRHLILPLAKSYLSSRERSVNQELQTNLSRALPEVLRIGRKTRVDVFVNSKAVQAAIDQAEKEGQGTREMLEFKVQEYAEELVPGFYSLFYFKIGYVLARAYIRLLYDVVIAKQPPPEVASIPQNASIVLVGNHRSNLDVMLLAYLASRTSMVSFAAGEWGRAWPMSTLLHISGSYIIRRTEGLALYRKVLKIHLQNLVKVKMPQGIFLEGGLTRDGSMQPVKLGLLSYLLSALGEENVEDIVFIPVAFNYGQVPEGKTLLNRQEHGFTDQSKLNTVLSTLRSLLKVIYRRVRRGRTAYGRSAVSFGQPISMNQWIEHQGMSAPINDEQKKQIVSPVADEIISKISEMIPVLPVTIVASVFKTTTDGGLELEEILEHGRELLHRFQFNGATIALDQDTFDQELLAGLDTLLARKVLQKNGNCYNVARTGGKLLDYLHNSTKHLIED